MTADTAPDWAREEAVKRLNAELSNLEGRAYWRLPRHAERAEVIAMARLIAKHEQPPEDPDLATAREAAARHNELSGHMNIARDIRDKLDDDCREVQLALAAIKLHKERKPKRARP